MKDKKNQAERFYKFWQGDDKLMVFIVIQNSQQMITIDGYTKAFIFKDDSRLFFKNGNFSLTI